METLSKVISVDPELTLMLGALLYTHNNDILGAILIISLFMIVRYLLLPNDYLNIYSQTNHYMYKLIKRIKEQSTHAVTDQLDVKNKAAS